MALHHHRKHWLIKQEPTAYPFSQLVKDGKTAWTGVRNYQARNFLRAMKIGDLALYYHSVDEKSVVGVAEVIKVAYEDPTMTADETDWSCVDVRAVKAFKSPVSLAMIKADPELKEMAFLRQTRLSVSAVRQPEYARILKLGGL